MRLFVAALCFVASTAVHAQFQQTDADAKYATELLKTGTAIPDFKLPDLKGKKQTLSKLVKGKYAVIDFWASWCPDCRKDIPNVKRMYQKFAPLGVQFIGVSFDDDANKWREAVAQNELNYTQVSELKRMRDSDVAKAFGVKWIPSMMLVDKEGKVLLSTVLSDKMERTLTELMAKENPAVVKSSSQRVTIDGAKGTLAAIIQKPELAQGQKCPIVMLCHGFSGRN